MNDRDLQENTKPKPRQTNDWIAQTIFKTNPQALLVVMILLISIVAGSISLAVHILVSQPEMQIAARVLLSSLLGGVFVWLFLIIPLRRYQMLEREQSGVILEKSPIGIIIINARGTITSLNPSAAKIFGYKTSELLGKKISLLMIERDEKEHTKAIERYLQTGTSSIIGKVEREVQALTKFGMIIDVSVIVNEFRVDEEVFFVGFLYDISQRKNLARELQAGQDAMARANMVSTISEVSSNIAHEINSPLGTLLSTCDSALEYLHEEPINRNAIELLLTRARDTVQRVSKVVKETLAVSRKAHTDTQTLVNVRDIIKNLQNLNVQNFYSRGIQFIVKCPADFYVKGNSVQLTQALMNLVSNSCDALEISPEKKIILSVSEKEGAVEMIFEDTGPGIPPEFREKIFQPYFTTKEREKGTGLGLSIVKRIITNHNGSFNLISNSEKTQFCIQIPKANVISGR